MTAIALKKCIVTPPRPIALCSAIAKIMETIFNHLARYVGRNDKKKVVELDIARHLTEYCVKP